MISLGPASAEYKNQTRLQQTSRDRHNLFVKTVISENLGTKDSFGTKTYRYFCLLSM